MLGAISVVLSTNYIVKGTLLFLSFNIEVGYCREVEPDGGVCSYFHLLLRSPSTLGKNQER